MKNKIYRSNIIPVLFIFGVVPYISMCINLSNFFGGLVLYPYFLPIKIFDNPVYEFLPIVNCCIIMIFAILYDIYIENLYIFIKKIKLKSIKMIVIVFFTLVGLSYLISIFFNYLSTLIVISYVQREYSLMQREPLAMLYFIVLILAFVVYAISSLIIIYKSIRHFRGKNVSLTRKS